MARIGFVPFSTFVIGAHVSDPVAQQFYFGALLVNGLVWVVLIGVYSGVYPN